MKVRFYLLIGLLLCVALKNQGQSVADTTQKLRFTLFKTCFLSQRDLDKIEFFKTLPPVSTDSSYRVSWQAGYSINRQGVDVLPIYATLLQKKYGLTMDEIYGCVTSEEEETKITMQWNAIEQGLKKNIRREADSLCEKITHYLGIVIDSKGNEKAVNLDRLPFYRLPRKESDQYTHYFSPHQDEYSWWASYFDFKQAQQQLQFPVNTEIVIRCVIDKKGKITEAVPLPEKMASFSGNERLLGHLFAEALFKTSDYWKPAIYKGKKVKSVAYLTFSCYSR